MSNVPNPQQASGGDAAGVLVVTMGEDEEPAPASGSVSSSVSNARFDVCPTWLELAIRHLSDAQVARGARIGTWDVADESAKTSVLKWEFEASIQAITASGIALDSFCAAVQARIHVPEGLIAEWQEKRTPRHVQMSEVLRRAFSLAAKHVNSVRQSLEEIFRFRDLAIDPSAKTNARILHPELGIGVEWRFAYFRYQNAQLIVTATLRLIAELVARCKPEEAELQEYVDALRASLDTLQGASALISGASALKSQPPDVHPIQAFPEENSIRTARR
jgi:hypothetical protein